MYGYIYKTTNLVNGKIYIGKKVSSTFLENKYLGSGTLLQEAIKKYGKNEFQVELLEECSDKTELCEKEIYWIATLNAQDKNIGYNIANGGEGGGGRKGHPMTEATKQKMRATVKNRTPERQQEISQMCRERQLGRTPSEETREKMRKSMLGKNTRKHTPEENEKNRLGHLGKNKGENNPAKRLEVREKIRQSKLGHEVSVGTREKLSKANIGKIVSEETRKKQSNALKGRPSGTAGKIAVHKDGRFTMILPEMWDIYEKEGWKRGRK